jgi:hypothetical protein
MTPAWLDERSRAPAVELLLRPVALRHDRLYDAHTAYRATEGDVMGRAGRSWTTGIAGLLCVAVVALGAGTASASAPVFFGKAAVGSAVASVPFTFTAEASFFEGAGGTKVTCKSGGGSGEITGATEVSNVTLAMTGCELGGGQCGTEPHNEIAFKTLAGSLGNVTPTIPGIRLFDQAGGRSAPPLEFTCAGGAVRVKVRGSLIGALTGASGTSVQEGKLALAPKIAFVENKGIQKYVQFLPGEGEAGAEQLELSSGGGFEPVGLQFDKSLPLKSTPLPGQFGFTK